MLSWLFAAVAHALGKPKPYSWPYYGIQTQPGVWNDHHQDLWVYTANFKSFHTPNFFSPHVVPFAYPPSTALLYRLFLPNLRHPAGLFDGCIVVVVATLSIGLVLKFRGLGIKGWQAGAYVSALAVFSAPLAFEFNRLNMEIFVFALESIAIYCLLKERYVAFGGLVGALISLKLYPFMLLALLLGRARTGLAWLAAAVSAVGLTLAGWWAETGSIPLSMQKTSAGMGKFSSKFVLTPGQADGWDHSIFGLIKFLRFQVDAGWSVHRWYLVYMVAAALLATALFFLRIRKLPIFNQVTCLVLFTVLLPPTSFEYTLLSVSIPLAMFCALAIRYANGGLTVPRGNLYAWCFGITSGLVGFVFCGGFVLWRGGNCGAQAKCLALLVLLGVTLTTPLPLLQKPVEAGRLIRT